jgi:hypothetical protein
VKDSLPVAVSSFPIQRGGAVFPRLRNTSTARTRSSAATAISIPSRTGLRWEAPRALPTSLVITYMIVTTRVTEVAAPVR